MKDRNGSPVKLGDKVSFNYVTCKNVQTAEGIVTFIGQSEFVEGIEYCNVSGWPNNLRSYHIELIG